MAKPEEETESLSVTLRCEKDDVLDWEFVAGPLWSLSTVSNTRSEFVGYFADMKHIRKWLADSGWTIKKETRAMPTMYVAFMNAEADGSGRAQVLGIYSTRERAEARCFREIEASGYPVPTEIFEIQVDVDIKE